MRVLCVIKNSSCSYDEKSIDIHMYYRFPQYNRSCSAFIYKHINMMKEMMKFSSLPEERLVINSKTGEMLSDPKNR